MLHPSFYFGGTYSLDLGKVACMLSLITSLVFSSDIEFCYLVYFLVVNSFTLLGRYFSTFLFHQDYLLFLAFFFG